jgi:hypothetical protein
VTVVNREVLAELITQARARQVKAEVAEDGDLWEEATLDMNRHLDRWLERRELVSHGVAPDAVE